MEAAEEADVLPLHGGQKAIASPSIGSGHGFLNQPLTDSSPAAKSGMDAQASAVPQARFCFVNAHDAHDAIACHPVAIERHDGIGNIVRAIDIAVAKKLLLVAKDRLAQVEISPQVFGGLGQFESVAELSHERERSQKLERDVRAIAIVELRLKRR